MIEQQYTTIPPETAVQDFQSRLRSTWMKGIRDLYQEFRAASDAGVEAPPHQLLTAREHEILCLMAAGMTNPQIAAQLVIGAGTVKTHTLHIYRKLDVANRAQAIALALALGFLCT